MDIQSAKKNLKSVPRRPGVYRYFDAFGTILYVGKALSLRDRLSSYFLKNVHPKTAELIKAADHFEYTETGSEFTALLLEAKLIKLHRPKYNVSFRDDKSYLYIFISTKEEFPKVFLTRRPKGDASDASWSVFEGFKGEYFGPFPSAYATRQILKWLRSLFPFCQQKNIGKRACFYSHLGLCKPCPAEIVQTSGEQYQALKKIYRKNISHLTRILEGSISNVSEELEKEMKHYAKNEEFEKAQHVRNQTERLKYLLEEHFRTSVFLDNPNFYVDTQKEATGELREILREQGLMVEPISKLECFDISNFQGHSSVASQVVFVDGVANTDLYRRYRIQLDGKPNDFAMMREAISRRLTHTEWSLPQLLIVDGGKPQVSTIFELLKEKNIQLPLIGLAKRFETIVLVKDGKLIEVKLPRRSPAIKLLQQIRDEAHRFAITYHRKVRGKKFTK